MSFFMWLILIFSLLIFIWVLLSLMMISADVCIIFIVLVLCFFFVRFSSVLSDVIRLFFSVLKVSSSGIFILFFSILIFFLRMVWILI